MFTKDDVSSIRSVNGEDVLLSDAERQALATEWNSNLPTPEQIAAQQAAQEKAAADAAAALAAKQDAFIATISGFTMVQVDNFVDTNFASFTNTQKNFLKAVGKLAVLAARRL